MLNYSLGLRISARLVLAWLLDMGIGIGTGMVIGLGMGIGIGIGKGKGMGTGMVISKGTWV